VPPHRSDGVREEQISMTKTTRVLIVAAFMAAAGSEGRAQTQQTPPAPASMGFLNVNIGAQAASRSVEVSQTFPVYGETASVNMSQSIGSGALFDIAAGYRVWRSVTAAIGFSNFSNSSDSTGSARVPHPLVTNQFATVQLSQPGLEHSERTVHFQAVWLYPVTNEFDVTFGLGPSIFNVKQEVVSSVTVPPGTQDAIPNVASESKTVLGANIQLDGNYLVRRNFGAGAFIRWASRKVDLPSAPDLRLGGFQIGAGARIRF
jgi:hypothetical protein